MYYPGFKERSYTDRKTGELIYYYQCTFCDAKHVKESWESCKCDRSPCIQQPQLIGLRCAKCGNIWKQK
jgi:hypothetical protein